LVDDSANARYKFRVSSTCLVESLLEESIRARVFPGAAWFAGSLRSGSWDVRRGFLGRIAFETAAPEVGPDTLWDLASLTKVIAATSCAMKLAHAGELDLNEPVASQLPGFEDNSKGHITPLNLLLHNSGLAAGRPFHTRCRSSEQAWQLLMTDELAHPPGTTVYSDLGMIVLGRLLETICQTSLDRLFAVHVGGPLALREMGFCPEFPRRARCAPTEPVEVWRAGLAPTTAFRASDGATVTISEPLEGHFLQGEVHDPSARMFGGISGNAGLFATLDDVAAFGMAMLEAVTVGHDAFPPPPYAQSWVRRWGDGSSRALGWDTRSPVNSSAGSRFSSLSFGHTGFTGTSLWIDPEQKLVAVLLTNRVHPRAAGTGINQVRPMFHDRVAEVMLP
jgi:CubicO group peptidase (beta-lactamase class C family)